MRCLRWRKALATHDDRRCRTLECGPLGQGRRRPRWRRLRATRPGRVARQHQPPPAYWRERYHFSWQCRFSPCKSGLKTTNHHSPPTPRREPYTPAPVRRGLVRKRHVPRATCDERPQGEWVGRSPSGLPPGGPPRQSTIEKSSTFCPSNSCHKGLYARPGRAALARFCRGVEQPGSSSGS